MAAISQSLQKNLIFRLSPPKVSASPRDLPLRKIGKAWWVPVLFLLATTMAVRAGDYSYITNSDNTLTITRYIGPGGDVVIPYVIGSRMVYRIGDSAFAGIGSVETVTIPNTVVSIGSNAFRKCSSLINVTISSSVTNFGDEAFYECSLLPSVTIPDSVTRIGKTVFALCTSLTNVAIGNSVTSIGDEAFYGCNLLPSVTIPNSVTSIGIAVFARCSSLPAITVDAGNSVYSSVDGILFNKNQTILIEYPEGKAGNIYMIPSSVTSIVDYAFYYCRSLTSVTIPSGLINIGDGAFAKCFNLTNVTIPDSVTSIRYGAFAMPGWPESSRLASVTIGAGVTNIGDYAFLYCDNLTNVTIPDSVTRIGNYAFAMWPVWFESSRLASVTIGAGVTNIGNYAFSHCRSLGSVFIPKGIIGTGAFTSSGLTNVTMGTGVTSIGDEAFAACGSLKSVMISDSVTSIGNRVFYFCYSLTSITVDPGNFGYSSVDGILFNKSQTELIQYPARKAGRSYTILDSVTSIGNEAFYYTLDLTAVVIPSSVTSIGDSAFFSCYHLKGAYFAGNAPGIGSYVFYGDDLATIYYLPETIGWGWTFGGRPAMPWWDGPQISANGSREDMSLNRGEPVKITVATEANSLAARPLDWWIIAWANDIMFYLNSSREWTQSDRNLFSNCRPVYQGSLFNLPSTEVLNTTELPIGSYTFWFAVDYPMDGILNLGGYILIDSVNVIVH